MFKYALIFAATLIGFVHGNQPCLGAPAHQPSFVASPISCDSYTICMNGQAIHGERCPQGLLFEPTSQTCSSSSCTTCSPFGIQNLPNPQYCNQYIQCVMGTRTFSTCPFGHLFDRNLGFCNTAELVNCVDDPAITTISPEPTTPPSTELPTCMADGLYHAHPTDCTRFFICVQFKLWEQECSPGLHWNKGREMCDAPASAQCVSVGDTE